MLPTLSPELNILMRGVTREHWSTQFPETFAGFLEDGVHSLVLVLLSVAVSRLQHRNGSGSLTKGAATKPTCNKTKKKASLNAFSVSDPQRRLEKTRAEDQGQRHGVGGGGEGEKKE